MKIHNSTFKIFRKIRSSSRLPQIYVQHDIDFKVLTLLFFVPLIKIILIKQFYSVLISKKKITLKIFTKKKKKQIYYSPNHTSLDILYI